MKKQDGSVCGRSGFSAESRIFNFKNNCGGLPTRRYESQSCPVLKQAVPFVDFQNGRDKVSMGNIGKHRFIL
jgi:hypothetical protein